MRILRLVASADPDTGRLRLSLLDEKTRAAIPDVLRVEFSPLEAGDSRWTAVVIVHDRDAAGEYRYDGGQPVTTRHFVELRVGTVWEV